MTQETGARPSTDEACPAARPSLPSEGCSQRRPRMACAGWDSLLVFFLLVSLQFPVTSCSCEEMGKCTCLRFPDSTQSHLAKHLHCLQGYLLAEY